MLLPDLRCCQITFAAVTGHNTWLQDRQAVEDDYQLVSAADAILNDDKELRDIVVAQRAENDEDDSEDQDNRRASSDRGATPQRSRSQARAHPAEQKPGKGLKRGRGRNMLPQPHSPTRPAQRELAPQPQQAQPELDEPQVASAANWRSQPHSHAVSTREMPNGHAQSQAAAHPAQSLVIVGTPQITVLDAHNRETRMCSWCPTAAVLASG